MILFTLKVLVTGQAWWLTLVIPALEKLRQEDDYEFEDNLG